MNKALGSSRNRYTRVLGVIPRLPGTAPVHPGLDVYHR